MWRKWIATAILMGALAAIGAAQAKFLNNDDVVSMVKAGQADDTILTAIQNQGTDFDVSTKAVLSLKKAGVSKKVIDAMIGAVKDQKEAAAAVISAAQEKAAAQEAEDKADQARADAARAQHAAGGASGAPNAMGAGGAMPAMVGVPTVTMVQNGQKQALSVAHTQIVPTNTQLSPSQMQASSMGSSMNGLASDGGLSSNLGSLAKMLASGGGMPGMGGMGLPIGGLPGAGGKGTAIASTLMMANPMLSGAMIAGSLLKHKMQASQAAAAGATPGQSAPAQGMGMGMGLVPGQSGAAAGMGQGAMTAVWAIPGAKSETVIHGGAATFEVQLDATAGVNPEEYEPVLIRLTSTQTNFRLVGATTLNPAQLQSADANWNLYASFVEQRLPAQAAKVGSGHYTLQAGSGLTAGEYAVVLRPVSKDKKFAGNNVGQNVGDGMIFNCVWSFEVQ